VTERGRVFVALEGPARPARSAINLTYFCFSGGGFFHSHDPFKWQFHISVCGEFGALAGAATPPS
jgi:hypothetical protein